MYCKFCGSEVYKETQYCPKCGKAVNSAEHIKKKLNHETRNDSHMDISKGLVSSVIILLLCIVGVCIAFAIIYNNRTKTKTTEKVDKVIQDTMRVADIGNTEIETTEEIEETEETDEEEVEDKVEDEEIIPTAEEIKIINEADMLLEKDDPLGAAEVLTKAMAEDYYPAVYEKLKEIRKNTRDYEMHTISKGSDGNTINESIFERVYDENGLRSETEYDIRDGERIILYTNTYSDETGNYTHSDVNVNAGETTNYIKETVKDGNKTIVTEYVDKVGGRINRIDTIEDGKNIRMQLFNRDGELYHDDVTEYDENGRKTKNTNIHNGTTETTIYQYEDGKYGRVIKEEVKSEVKESVKTYDYNETGYFEHVVTNQKKYSSLGQGYNSTYDCEHNALGGAIHSESKSTQDDGSVTEGNTTYSHDYHYFDSSNLIINEDSEDQTDYYSLYNEQIKKVVSGEEMIYDEGELYEYSNASNPGYALYDIDGNGIEELFITGDKDSKWHTYAVYYVKDGAVELGKAINGYIPDKDWWIYGFEYVTDAFTFNSKDGFVKAAEINYPVDDEDVPITISYEGKKPVEMTDVELDALLSREIVDPKGIKWERLAKETVLQAK